MHARKRKVLAEHLSFLLWPVIHYRTLTGVPIKLRGGGKYRKFNKRGDVYLAPKSTNTYIQLQLLKMLHSFFFRRIYYIRISRLKITKI